MTTEVIHKDAPCGKQIRVKRWTHGFSIKCMQGKKTKVGRPYSEYYYQYDLKTFCDGCEKAKQ